MVATLLADLGIGRLFDLVPDPVVVGDVATGRIIGWNSAAAQIFGYPLKSAIGMELERLVPPQLREAHLAGLARYAAGGGGHLTGSRELVELPALHADGHQFWVELRLATIDPPETPRRHVLAVFRDVTARREAMQRAETANAALREFLAMAAHDLRAPAAGVAMTLDMLVHRGDELSPSQRSDLLAGARRQAAFIVDLLGKVADVSAIESGQEQPAAEEAVVDAVVRQAVEVSGAAVEVDVPVDLRVNVDPRHLQRILLNLIGNAQRYGRPPITVRATRGAGTVIIDVEDEGEGVPAELRDRMFDKFVRGAAPGGASPGSGLGLAIVAGLVRAGGGAVGFEELPGGGSRFRCTWPDPPAAG